MRLLTEEEVERVSGGGFISEMAADFGAVGTVIGYVADSSLMGATRGGMAGAMIGASFGGGYIIGERLYDWLSGS